jgi:YD repeat-containing protein
MHFHSGFTRRGRVLLSIASAFCLLTTGLSTLPAGASPSGSSSASNQQPPAPDNQGLDRRPVPAVTETERVQNTKSAKFPDDDQLTPDGLEELNEFSDLNSESGRVFGEGHSPHVVQSFGDVVNFQDDDGDWQPIDPSLVAIPGGYSNASGPFTARLPEVLSADTHIEFEADWGGLALSPRTDLTSTGQADQYTISYPEVWEDTDLRYWINSESLKEDIVLRSISAPTAFEWEVAIEGAVLRQGDGVVEVIRDGEVVSVLSAPYMADDNDVSAEPEDVDISLRSIAGQSIVAVSVSPAWLHDPDRAFPVTIDPTTTNGPLAADKKTPLLKDAYVESVDRERFTGGLQYLKVGTETGGSRVFRTFMTYDVFATIRQVGDLIYDARFSIHQDAFSGSGQLPFYLRRVTANDGWVESNLTWATQPQLETDTSFDQGPYLACQQSQDCPDGLAGGWYTFDVGQDTVGGKKNPLQYWIDAHAGSNHGWAMLPQTNADRMAVFDSKEAGPLKFSSLIATVNGMPGTQPFAMDVPQIVQLSASAPNDQAVLNTKTPVLGVADLIDPNDDPILVRYQVATDAAFTNIIVGASSSDWRPEGARRFVVPEGVLRDNQTYHWRVQASDACTGQWAAYEDQDPGEEGLCDDLGRGRPTSQPRSFTTDIRRPGIDDRWAMWHQELGNGMIASVNKGNGNFILRYPLDSWATPIGPLDVSVAYNSQPGSGGVVKDRGLSKGWSISAGPPTRSGQVVSHLDISSTSTSQFVAPYAVAVVYESGRREEYASIGDSHYAAAGPGAGSVRRITGENGQMDGWIFRTPSGGVYSFDKNGELESGVASTSTATTPGFTYEFSNNDEDSTTRRLIGIQDPANGTRKLTFTWDASLEHITKIVDGMSPTTREWNFEYELIAGEKRLKRIKEPMLAGGAVPTITFDYDSLGRLSGIHDAQAGPSGPATTIAYQALTGPARPVVTSVTPDSSPSTAWTFEYINWDGALAATSKVTDPRGTATTGDTTDYQVITEFNLDGLPIQEKGPYVEEGWPTSVWTWDSFGNLICSKTPLQEALTDATCNRGAVSGLQTDYYHQQRAPYLVKRVVGGAANANATPDRLETTTTYDGGFEGLQVDYFQNQYLAGRPAKEAISNDVNQSWTSAGPTDVGVPFSARWFGDIQTISSTTAQTYEFRVVHTRGIRLGIGREVLLDCMDHNNSQTNCSNDTPAPPDPSVELSPGVHPIFVELNGGALPASVQLQWKTPGASSFVPVPGNRLSPGTDLVTEIVEDSASNSAGDVLSRTAFEYGGAEPDLRKLTGTPSRVTVSGARTPKDQVSTFTYEPPTESPFNRLRKEIDPLGAEIVHHYAGACEDSTTDRMGLQVTRMCGGPGGRVTRETQEDVNDRDFTAPSPGNTTNDRTTLFEYDSLGRPTKVTYPDGGDTLSTYDLAGRLTGTSDKISGSTRRATTFAYNVPARTMTEILPTTAAGTATVVHTYDMVGNEISTLDERGKLWTATFDAMNLRRTKTAPADGSTDVWDFHYDLEGNLVRRDDPIYLGSRVSRHRHYDALGRLRGTHVGGLVEASYTYDPRGNMIMKTDPDGVYVGRTYDALSRLVSETVPTGQDGAPATRAFEYDERGFMNKSTDLEGNESTNGYDAMGRLTSVTAPHGPPNQSIYTYNKAGDLMKVSTPGEIANDEIVTEFGHDLMGRVTQELDGRGRLTKHNYDFVGNETCTIDPRGLTLRFEYDLRGQRTSRSSLNGNTCTSTVTPQESYAYDLAGNLKTAANGTASTAMTYDNSGRLKTVTSGERATSYVYVGRRLRQRIDDPSALAGDERTMTYNYESIAGRLDSVSDSATNALVSYAFSDGGRIIRRWDSNGLVHVFDYEQAGSASGQAPSGRLAYETVTKDGEQVAQFWFRYDKDSRVTARSQVVGGGAGHRARG